jgi:hypothetical protein
MLMIRVTVNLNKFGKPYVANRMQIDKEFREKDDDYTVVTLDDVQPETEDRTAWLYGPNVFRELTNEEYVVVNVWTEHVTVENREVGESTTRIKDIVVIQRKSHSRSGLESKTE